MKKIDLRAHIQSLHHDIGIIIEKWDESGLVFLCEIAIPIGVPMLVQIKEMVEHSGIRAPLMIEALHSESEDSMFRYQANFENLKPFQKAFIKQE
jgi:hypothetical protein